jgi:hypothetical protein
VYYRLMFGSGFKALPDGLPERVRVASAEAKAVLRAVIVRGAETGVFAVSAADPMAVLVAALEGWSVVHGLTMLFLDRLPGEECAHVPPLVLAEAVVRRSISGLLRG